MNLNCDSRASARIVVIDDDKNCVRALVHMLQSDGYTGCEGMSEPSQVLALLAQTVPDLILLDWHMEKTTGLQVLTALKKQCSEEDMPDVIVMTGDCDRDTRHMALNAGASDFLMKPLDCSEVSLRIRNLLRLRSLHQHVQSEKTRLEEVVHERTAQLRQTIEELKGVQQQVIAEERMRAFAAMAGGIAHDFNNSLMIIRGYSELYSEFPDAKRTMEDLLKGYASIALASRDASEIVRRLRTFYRPFSEQYDVRRPIDVNKLIEETVDLARHNWETQAQARGIGISVTTILQEVPNLHGSAVELREVILNLILNAVYAMPQGGGIVIRTQTRGDEIAIEVEDNGTGMTPETARRCLEPFFSTKGAGGTGLGLAIVYGIIQRHRGSVQIRSEISKGTCFSLTLPQGSADTFLPNEFVSIPIQRHLRILFVDDDPNVCLVMRRFLEVDDHSVTTAGSGSEALEKFAAGEFDLVIMDRVMPKMSGEQLADALRLLKPAQPIILLTGFEGTEVLKQISLQIYKPVNLAGVRDAIGRVMDETAMRESLSPHS